MENNENSGKRTFTLKLGEDPKAKIKEKEQAILNTVLYTSDTGELVCRIDALRKASQAALGYSCNAHSERLSFGIWELNNLIDRLEDILRIRLENQNV